MFPVTTIIETIAADFKDTMLEIVENRTSNIAEIEMLFVGAFNKGFAAFVTAYIEELDREILEDKKGRKEKGLVVQRREDPRQLLTLFGEVNYNRTYYKKAVGYEYPVDTLTGIDSYSRISSLTESELVDKACTVSYGKSSEFVTNGVVSRQTVMSKIRNAYAPEPQDEPEKRKVKYLHIDADEDHVSVRKKKSAIVPVISVYEGIETHNKRRKCTNIFHISEYGRTAAELWEKVLTGIENRYDISDTRIYIHGDGADWIAEGLEWFTRPVFVLDPYHKNKRLKQLLTGFTLEDRKAWSKALETAFRDGDKDFLTDAGLSMIESYPERAENIVDNMQYLINNFDGIHVRYVDEEARNGGATEPHVQHVLSYRLSSTPHVWSEETLRHLVPILAAGEHTFEEPVVMPQPKLKMSDLEAKKRKTVPYSAGLPDPGKMIFLPAKQYKRCPIQRILTNFSNSNF